MVDLIDTNGVKPTLKKGVLGYDDYNAGGDAGRLYVGTGTESIAQAKLSEVQDKAGLTNPKFTANISFGNTDLSSWSGTFSVLEGAGGTFFASNGTVTLTGSNCYYDGANWRYKIDGTAGLQLVNQGIHTFRTAVAGLANAVITWVTQANIDANGLTGISNMYVKTDVDTLVSAKIPKISTPTTKALARVKSDGTLENSAITIDDNGNIGSGNQTFNGLGGSGFKNYIINGGMDIWQRGTLFSNPANETWTADRWKIGWAGGTVTQVYKGGEVFSSGYNTLAIDGKAGNTVLELRQYIESLNCRKLKAGAKVTVSFDVYTNTGFTAKNLGVVIDRPIAIDGFSTMYDGISGTITLSAGQQAFRKSVTFTIPTNYFSWGTRLVFVLPTGLGAGETIAFGNVQFEDGSVATPFEQRPYGLELSLCQRYYETGLNTIRRQNIDTVGRNWYESYSYKVLKRVTPTISQTLSSTSGVGSVSIDGTVTYVNWVCAGNGTSIDFQFTSNWTASAEL